MNLIYFGNVKNICNKIPEFKLNYLYSFKFVMFSIHDFGICLGNKTYHIALIITYNLSVMVKNVVKRTINENTYCR